VRHRAHRTIRGLPGPELLTEIVATVNEIREAAEVPVRGVGFGIPCLIERETGAARFSNHTELEGVAFAAMMSERLAVPVAVDNDANASVVAEHRLGVARGLSEVAMLTIGTGIGSGLVLSGKLYSGAEGYASELGHTVVEIDGPPCPGNCPNHGCLEAVASGLALEREARFLAEAEPRSSLGREVEAGRELTGIRVVELAHDGDDAALRVVALVGRRLGVGIANVINALNPEMVVIGGGIAAAGELLLAPAREVVAARALPFARDRVRIEAARFGPEAGMVGAGLLAWDAVEAELPWG
jgi:glucokinase